MDPGNALKIYLDQLADVIDRAKDITETVTPPSARAEEFVRAKKGLEEAKNKHRELVARLRK
jgi:hypothetical protein